MSNRLVFPPFGFAALLVVTLEGRRLSTCRAGHRGRRRFFGIVRGLRIRGGPSFLLRLAGLLRQVTGRLGVHLLQAARLRVTVAADAFGSAFRRPASG